MHVLVGHCRIVDYHLFRRIIGYGNLPGNLPGNCDYRVTLVTVNPGEFTVCCSGDDMLCLLEIRLCLPSGYFLPF
jgi:hypothetical protein